MPRLLQVATLHVDDNAVGQSRLHVHRRFGLLRDGRLHSHRHERRRGNLDDIAICIAGRYLRALTQSNPTRQQVRFDAALASELGQRDTGLLADLNEFPLHLRVIDASTIALVPDHQALRQLSDTF
jgi:hypothetical protein